MQPYRSPLLPCKFCSYACQQWCSKSPSQYNQCTERTSRSGSKYSGNPQALTAYASFGKKTPTPGRRQHELANGATLPQLIYPGSDFCSAQMYAVQTSSSGSEIPRVSSICSLVNLVCGKGSVNNLLKKGKNTEMNRFSHSIERKFPPNHPLWISQPSGQTLEQQAGRKQTGPRSLRNVFLGSAQASFLLTSDRQILAAMNCFHPSTGLLDI